MCNKELFVNDTFTCWQKCKSELFLMMVGCYLNIFRRYMIDKVLTVTGIKLINNRFKSDTTLTPPLTTPIINIPTTTVNITRVFAY